VDDRDFRIIVELYRHPFASYEAIGRVIGATGTAVKSRLDRLEKRGVIGGFYVTPAARVFGRHRHIFAFLEVETEPNLKDVLDVEDVANVFRGRPGMIMVNTFDPSPEAGPPARLLKLMGRPPYGAVLPDSPEEISEKDAVLSPLDWRVLDVLVDGPRVPLRELARRTGLTARTVRKRRDALVAKHLLTVSPIIDTSREPGLIVYSGYVTVKRKSDLRHVRAPGLVWAWAHHEPPAAAIFGCAATYAEAQEAEHTLESLPGVTRVVLTVARGGGEAKQRLHEWIRAELARWNTLTVRAQPPQQSRAKRVE